MAKKTKNGENFGIMAVFPGGYGRNRVNGKGTCL